MKKLYEEYLFVCDKHLIYETRRWTWFSVNGEIYISIFGFPEDFFVKWKHDRNLVDPISEEDFMIFVIEHKLI